MLLSERKLLRKHVLLMQMLIIVKPLSKQAPRHLHLHLKVRAAVHLTCAGLMACMPDAAAESVQPPGCSTASACAFAGAYTQTCMIRMPVITHIHSVSAVLLSNDV